MYDQEKKRESVEDEAVVTRGASFVADEKTTVVTKDGQVVNASGHRDQLNRQYGLLSICGLALTIDNAWVALGGSLTISIRKSSMIANFRRGVCLIQSSERWSSRRALRASRRLYILRLRRCKHR